MQSRIDLINTLPCWSSSITIEPLAGGLTNSNFLIEHQNQPWVVRVAQDIPVHGIVRQQEMAALKAAELVGLSPKILYSTPQVTVTLYIEGQVLNAELIKQPETITRVIQVLKKAHTVMPQHLPIPHTLFWVFAVNRHYLKILNNPELKFFSDCNNELEEKVHTRSLIFGHNDLLAANFIDDGKKLWLIDWEYAGFGDPLFDIAGLAANHDFNAQEEDGLLEAYFEQNVSDALRYQLALMKCAAALREMLWSLASEQYSELKTVDYVSYTEQNRARFMGAYDLWKKSLS